MRRANTLLALQRLTWGEPWVGRRYSYRERKTVTEEVTPGPGCQRIMRVLSESLRGGLSGREDSPAGTPVTARASVGQYQGSARWSAKILSDEDDSPTDDEDLTEGGQPQESWRQCVSQGPLRPHAKTIMAANSRWFSCGRSGSNSAPCSEIRCPACWEGGEGFLKNRDISCSRFKQGVSPTASSRTGRWKGADAKSATTVGPTPRDWAVGEGKGESVEIFTSPEARRDDLSGDGEVTLALLLYFFDIEGNQRPDSAEAGPTMEYVLAYEYVTCGAGRAKKADKVTQHPTYVLKGGVGTLPSVFPAEAIRRHIHMYHLCPVESYEIGTGSTPPPHLCGLRDEDRSKGGGKVWKHHYHLAAAHPPNGRRDAYMLNEHWRSAFQDGVV